MQRLIVNYELKGMESMPAGLKQPIEAWISKSIYEQ